MSMIETIEKISRFRQFDDVVYCPRRGNQERGMVSSFNERFVFVKFYEQLRLHGWNGTTAQACSDMDLARGD